MPLGTSMMMTKNELIAAEANRLFRQLSRIVDATRGDGNVKISSLTLKFTTSVEYTKEDLSALATRVKATDLPLAGVVADDNVVEIDEHRRTLIIYVTFA